MSCFFYRGAVDADGRIEPGDMILAVSESLFSSKFFVKILSNKHRK